jgi:hypothetical protein
LQLEHIHILNPWLKTNKIKHKLILETCTYERSEIKWRHHTNKGIQKCGEDLMHSCLAVYIGNIYSDNILSLTSNSWQRYTLWNIVWTQIHSLIVKVLFACIKKICFVWTQLLTKFFLFGFLDPPFKESSKTAKYEA